MEGHSEADATLPASVGGNTSVGHGSAFQSVATCSDVGRACRLGCEEESRSALSENSLASHSSTSSAAALRSVVAVGSKEAAATASQSSLTRPRRLQATEEEAPREGEAPEATPSISGGGGSAVQLTEASLKASTIERQSAESCSYVELWQSRIGLLAEVVEGNNCEAEPKTTSTPPSAASMQASALTAAGGAPVGEPIPFYVELWQRRLDLLFDDDNREMDALYASPCATATKCSSSTKPDYKEELDLDMEQLKQDLSKWLSPEQMMSFGLRVEADHEKTSDRAQSGCSLCCAVVAAAASVLVPILAVSWCGL